MTKKKKVQQRYISKGELETIINFPIDAHSEVAYKQILASYTRSKGKVDRFYHIDRFILSPETNDLDPTKIARQMVVGLADYLKILKKYQDKEEYEQCQVIKDFIFECVDYFLEVCNKNHLKNKISYHFAAQLAQDLNYIQTRILFQ